MTTEAQPTVAEAAEARIKEVKKAEEKAKKPSAPSTDETHGNIGESIFNEVELLTKDGKITRSQAFDEIAARSGRKVGTVSANYYRVARSRGEVAPRTRRSKTVAPSGGSLASQVAAMERELEELRAWKARVEQLLK